MSPDLCEPVKGHYWTVDFSKGEGYKRPRKRGKSKKAALQASPDKDGDGEEEGPAEVVTIAADSPRSDVTSSASSSTRIITPPPPSTSGRPAQEAVQDVQIPGPPNARLPRVRRQAHEWQEEQERMNRVFAPYPKVIQLEAVSPDERYRHYRMCTYLYPEDSQQRAQVPTELDLELLERTRFPRGAQKHPKSNLSAVNSVAWNSKYAEQPEQLQLVNHGGSNNSGPILSAVRDSRAANSVPEPPPARQTRTTTRSTPRVEYFAPSAASYQAYQAASTHLRSQSSDESDTPPPRTSSAGEDHVGSNSNKDKSGKHRLTSHEIVRPTLTRANDDTIDSALKSPQKKRKITYYEHADSNSEEEEIDELLNDE